MHRIHRAPVGTIALVGLLLNAAVAAHAGDGVTPGADELWMRAVAIAGANDRWTPGTIAFAAEERDPSGRVRSSWDVLMRAAPGADGRPVQEVLRYVEDGKDVASGRRPAAPKGGGRGPFSWNPSEPRQTPFHPATQALVSVRRLDSASVRDGKACVSYSFEQRLDGGSRAVGTAWLDASSGAPVGLQARLEPLPLFVSRAEITVSFDTRVDGSWVVRRFAVLGEATIVFVRRAFSMDLGLGEHWLLPAEAAAP